MGKLEVLSGKSAGTVLELEEDGTWEVGTGRRAGLRLRDQAISYTHASLTVEGGVCTLVDLRSRHGTFVNGERLSGDDARELVAGDTVTFGKTEARFLAEEPAEPEPEPAPERSASGRIEALREGAAGVDREEALRDELARTQETLAETSATLQETEAQLAEIEGELSNAIEDADAARRELDELKAAPAAPSTDPAELEAAKARIAELEQAAEAAPALESADPAELKAAQARIAELEAAVEAARTEGETNLESVFATVAAFEEKISEYEARIPELEAKVADLEGQLEKAQAEAKQASTAAQKAGQAYQDLKAETEQATTAAKKAGQAYQDLKAEADAARQEADELREQLEELNQELIEAQDELDRVKQG